MTAQDGVRVIDARGLVCPLPVLKARKILLSLPAGARLDVLVTDAAAPDDFRIFCDEAGHFLADVVHHAEGYAVVTVECGGQREENR